MSQQCENGYMNQSDVETRHNPRECPPVTSFTELENPKVHMVMIASPGILKASDRTVSYTKLKRQS